MRTLGLSAALACGALLAASEPGEYRISEPSTYQNLSIYLIHSDHSTGKDYLTLKAALEQKKVIVYETKNVNQLQIENVSNVEVFVQGGDIVKGGEQDRMIGNDFLLPPKSGKLPISAFCVEHGRWNARGEEPSKTFAASTETVTNREIALAVKSKKSQQEVWNEVAKTQHELSDNLVRNSASGSGGSHRVQAGMVTNVASPSSLQLTLETKAVTEAVDAYMRALAGAADGKENVVGFVYSINGELHSADVYGSPKLFAAMWPKLLKSAAVEAVRRDQKDKTFESPPVSAVSGFLRDAEGATESKAAAGKVTLVSKDADKQATFESRDGESVIHRSYVRK